MNLDFDDLTAAALAPPMAQTHMHIKTDQFKKSNLESKECILTRKINRAKEVHQ